MFSLRRNSPFVCLLLLLFICTPIILNSKSAAYPHTITYHPPSHYSIAIYPLQHLPHFSLVFSFIPSAKGRKCKRYILPVRTKRYKRPVPLTRKRIYKLFRYHIPPSPLNPTTYPTNYYTPVAALAFLSLFCYVSYSSFHFWHPLTPQSCPLATYLHITWYQPL